MGSLSTSLPIGSMKLSTRPFCMVLPGASAVQKTPAGKLVDQLVWKTQCGGQPDLVPPQTRRLFGGPHLHLPLVASDGRAEQLNRHQGMTSVREERIEAPETVRPWFQPIDRLRGNNDTLCNSWRHVRRLDPGRVRSCQSRGHTKSVQPVPIGDQRFAATGDTSTPNPESGLDLHRIRRRDGRHLHEYLTRSQRMALGAGGMPAPICAKGRVTRNRPRLHASLEDRRPATETPPAGRNKQPM